MGHPSIPHKQTSSECRPFYTISIYESLEVSRALQRSIDIVIGLGGIAILVLDISYKKYKTCGLTVLFGCFDLFIDLVLLVPDFCLQ